MILKRKKHRTAEAAEMPEDGTVQKKRSRSKKKKLLFSSVALILAASLGIGYAVLGGSNALAVEYEYVTAEKRNIESTLSGSGTVQPIHAYTVTALVQGEILSAPFEEGDEIEEGALLFQIDSDDVENSIERSNLSLQQKQLSHNETLESLDNLNVTSDISGVITTLYVSLGDTVQAGTKIADVRDRSTMTLEVPFNSSDAQKITVGQAALVTVDGSFETLSGTVSSVSTVDQTLSGNRLVRNVKITVSNPGALSENTYATATVSGIACNSGAQLCYASEKSISAKTSGTVSAILRDEGDAVSKNGTIVKLESSSLNQSVSNSELSLKDAELSLENTIEQLDNYRITSPIKGTVIEKNYEAGDTIDTSNGGSTLAVIYDMSSLTFEMSIDELDVSSVEFGQEVRITADAVEGQTFTGYVDKVHINGTSQNGVTSYPVTVVIDNPSADLLPGMNVTAEIVVSSKENVLSVPLSAISRGNTIIVQEEDG